MIYQTKGEIKKEKKKDIKYIYNMMNAQRREGNK